MSKYAIKATADSIKVDIIEFDESKSYETIKEATGGGWIDRVCIHSLGVDIWIDDEGKLTDTPNLNPFGTALWFMEHGISDYIAGDIIVTGGVDDEGNTLGMDKDKVTQVINEVHKVTKMILGNSSMVAEKLLESANIPAFQIIDLDE